MIYVRARVTIKMNVRARMHAHANTCDWTKNYRAKEAWVYVSLSYSNSLSVSLVLLPWTLHSAKERAKEAREKLQKGWPRMQVTIYADRSIILYGSDRPTGVCVSVYVCVCVCGPFVHFGLPRSPSPLPRFSTPDWWRWTLVSACVGPAPTLRSLPR